MGAGTAKLSVPDRRNDERRLQVTWHARQRVVVFSHWREGVCVATTPVDLSDLPRVVGVLVNALAEASTDPKSPEPSQTSLYRTIRRIVRSWIHPHMASIVELTHRPGRHEGWGTDRFEITEA